ncbi:hypothetical protein [Nocardia ninae]|uniref:hypothetical protein n=1 Tax=Nocardia ninae TaxID=356145 RepID=UPI0039EE5458
MGTATDDISAPVDSVPGSTRPFWVRATVVTRVVESDTGRADSTGIVAAASAALRSAAAHERWTAGGWQRRPQRLWPAVVHQ